MFLSIYVTLWQRSICRKIVVYVVYSSTSRAIAHALWFDSSRVATLVKVRSATRVSSRDPTRVKSNYIPHILRLKLVVNDKMRRDYSCPGYTKESLKLVVSDKMRRDYGV